MQLTKKKKKGFQAEISNEKVFFNVIFDQIFLRSQPAFGCQPAFKSNT